MKNIILLLLITFFFQGKLFSSNWVGGTGFWSNPNNWDPVGVPTLNDDVTIYNGDVTIDDDAEAKSIIFEGNSLTIDGVFLTIENSTGHGLWCNGGDVLNDGYISISNSVKNGLLNEGTGSFTNNGEVTITGTTGSYACINNKSDFYNYGDIYLDGTQNGSGIYNFSGSQIFINEGSVSIGINESIGSYGIENKATFINQNYGDITLGEDASIATIGKSAIINYSDAVKFENTNASIYINTTGSNYAGIDNRSIFNNNTDGFISYGEFVFQGIDNNGGTFNNNTGTVSILDYPLVESHILNRNGATFNNSGILELFGNISTNNKPSIDNSATFINNSTIEISYLIDKAIVNSDASATFTNNSGAEILVGMNDEVQSTGLEVQGSFTNSGEIRIGGDFQIGSIGIHLLSSSTFTNNGGSIYINNTVAQGILNTNGTFENINNAIIEIGLENLCNDKGIDNNGSFTNGETAKIEIYNVNSDAIYTSGGTFTNFGTYIHQLATFMAINGASGSTFINKTTGKIFSNGGINGNYFTNEGALNPGNSPGKLQIQNNFYTNSGSKFNIELGGYAPESEYDQIEFIDLSTDDISNTDLIVSYINGFEAAESDCFEIIIGNGFSGTFNSITRPTPPSGYTWVDTYTSTTYTMCLQEISLPMNNIYLMVKENINNVVLKWEIFNYNNKETKKFEIQKSHDAINWKTIDIINTKSFNSENKYLSFDYSPLNGLNYYRIKQINFDGMVYFSNVVSINSNNNKKEFCYPNPARYFVLIDGFENNNKISVYDFIGNKYALIKMSGNKYNTSNLKQGVYFIYGKNGNIIKLIID